ncbi:MAG TPA: hypothetical protein V6D12_23795 [Candidatus Obscuribacterales bacterium]
MDYPYDLLWALPTKGTMFSLFTEEEYSRQSSVILNVFCTTLRLLSAAEARQANMTAGG